MMIRFIQKKIIPFDILFNHFPYSRQALKRKALAKAVND